MPSALLPVAVGPRIATSRGAAHDRPRARSTSARAASSASSDEQADLLRPCRPRLRSSSRRCFVEVERDGEEAPCRPGIPAAAASSGSRSRIALRPTRVNASTARGLGHRDVGDAAVLVHVERDRPRGRASTSPPCGMNQLRRTCATNRASHGPNSTPLVSNWIDGRPADPGRPAGCRSSPAGRTAARCGSRRRSRRPPDRASPTLASCRAAAPERWTRPAGSATASTVRLSPLLRRRFGRRPARRRRRRLRSARACCRARTAAGCSDPARARPSARGGRSPTAPRAAAAWATAGPDAAARTRTARRSRCFSMLLTLLLRRLLLLPLDDRLHERNLRPSRIAITSSACRLTVRSTTSRRDIGCAMVGVSGRWSSKSKYIRDLTIITARPPDRQADASGSPCRTSAARLSSVSAT